jgi:hypothetical protein
MSYAPVISLARGSRFGICLTFYLAAVLVIPSYLKARISGLSYWASGSFDFYSPRLS